MHAALVRGAAQIKRPNSPFVIFVREKGKELRGQVKGNFLSAMSAAWRNLSPTERLPYEEVAEEEQLLYKKQREMMLKTVSVKGPRPVTVRDHDNSKYYGG